MHAQGLPKGLDIIALDQVEDVLVLAEGSRRVVLLPRQAETEAANRQCTVCR